jgi:hypothetical protein
MENLSTGKIGRLVLLPVDPYLMHVYWDLTSTAPPSAGVRPILRFHESGEHLPDRPFDVVIDLARSSWYVHLWSPNRSYYADLGWQASDGSFTPLARSNTIHTPRARPSTSVAGPIAEISYVGQPILAAAAFQAAELPPMPEPIELEVLEPEGPGPVELSPIDPIEEFAPELPELDLTEYAEERFTPGVSSARDTLGE